MVGGEGGSIKIKMLTVVDGRRGGRLESKNVKVLQLPGEGEVGLRKIKLLTVVDGSEGVRV